MTPGAMDRRAFARIFAAGGSAALLAASPAGALSGRGGSLHGGRSLRTGGGDVDWEAVRAEFLMPPGVVVLNAANLCPSTRSVLGAVFDYTERMDSEPMPSFRAEMHAVKEPARDSLARLLGAAPGEILITRNTSESNNWVSAGLDLGPGDEVVIVSDNHPSNNRAWKIRARRFGFSVRELPVRSPHPGMEPLLDDFASAINGNTRLIAFTHLTNTAGDLFPAGGLCALARERGVMSLVDGAQSVGLLDADVKRMDPDFYTGSAHKWPCGPKEAGVLYVRSTVHDRFHASVISAYGGQRGLARTHEGLGQRDEPAIRAFGLQVEFLAEIGMDRIEARSRALGTAAWEGLARINGVRMWTSPDPDLRAAVVTFVPGDMDPAGVVASLETRGIVAAARTGADRPGVRFSPHFYNSFEDVERAVAAVAEILR